jgi:hypothetical protein
MSTLWARREAIDVRRELRHRTPVVAPGDPRSMRAARSSTRLWAVSLIAPGTKAVPRRLTPCRDVEWSTGNKGRKGCPLYGRRRRYSIDGRCGLSVNAPYDRGPARAGCYARRWPQKWWVDQNLPRGIGGKTSLLRTRRTIMAAPIARPLGGEAETTGIARPSLVPGMNHCPGGPSTDDFDVLTPLADWVERGRAPERIGGRAGAAMPWPGRTRPSCSFPRQTRNGSHGNPETADSSAVSTHGGRRHGRPPHHERSTDEVSRTSSSDGSRGVTSSRGCSFATDGGPASAGRRAVPTSAGTGGAPTPRRRAPPAGAGRSDAVSARSLGPVPGGTRLAVDEWECLMGVWRER